MRISSNVTKYLYTYDSYTKNNNNGKIQEVNHISMCMSCSSTGKITKKKLAIFSAIGVGIGAATYFAFTATNNPAIAAVVPLLLVFAPCLGMCAVMGGIMWLKGRTSKKGNQTQNKNLTDEKSKMQPRKLNKGSEISGTNQFHKKM